MVMRLQLDRDLDIAALERALAATLRDLPRLHTRVVRRRRGYARVPMRDAAVTARSVIDETVGRGGEPAFVESGLDLAAGPPLRLLAVRPSAGEPAALSIKFHHAACD